MLASELAESVGIDATALSKIENGRRAVKSVELGRIAKALRVSPLALLEPESLPGKMPLAARMSGATVAMGSAYERLVSFTELHEVLAEHGIHSSSKLASVPSVVGAGWFEAAEALATWARGKLPLDGVDGDDRFAVLADHIQDELGIDVLVEPFPGDPLTGAAITDPAFPLLFVNAEHPLPRSLFTLAHELGHVLAGHDGTSVTLDRELSGSTNEERTANAFAANFLMPEETVRAAVKGHGRTETALIDLAYHLGVSFETLIFRLHNLGLIDATGRDSLRSVNWRQLVLHMPDPAVRGDLGPIAAARFVSRSVTPPPTIRPAILVARATTGFRKGIVGAHALAKLVGRDSGDLVGRFGDDPDLVRARQLIEADYRPQHEEAREERFSGLPY
ncbi:Zn-dependent peptidase ImmA (M78 family) [Mycolicibacterium moriokaense]|uniref:Zn-dependent peptidase ImmA (M78 family) n=2 Tax=Mycolicibacterium moriokaense TaxID=39691 RepID=A0A318HHI7_9MYCO|nr:Zn-dependent peptidase ImmA (M78 family) [Mycolicibacterium moriokaense]